MKTLLLTLTVIGLSLTTKAQCTAGATYTQYANPMDSGEVQFTNQCTGSSNANVYVTYGDGNTQSFPANAWLTNWTYSYTQPGTYQFCITINDSLNACTDTWCDSITISTVAAYCNAAFWADSTWTSLEWNFYPGGALTNVPVTHFWDFGDGNTSTAATPSHTYASQGQYYVCHTVTATGGQCSDTYCDTVYAMPPPPPASTPCSASYNWYQDSLTTQTVIMINNSVGSNGNPVTNYLWDFGDGNTSTQAYPSHTYATLGSYYVCLTIFDNTNPFFPCNSTYCDTVFVTFKQAGFTINVYPPNVTSVESLNLEPAPRELIKIVDLMGRETEDRPNTPLIYIYSDGTTEKVFRVE